MVRQGGNKIRDLKVQLRMQFCKTLKIFKKYHRKIRDLRVRCDERSLDPAIVWWPYVKHPKMVDVDMDH